MFSAWWLPIKETGKETRQADRLPVLAKAGVGQGIGKAVEIQVFDGIV